MSRGSLITIGIFSGILSLVLTLLTVATGDTMPIGYLGGFAVAFFFGCVASACLFEKGRWLTARITAAGVALGVLIGAVNALTAGHLKGVQLLYLVFLWIPLGIACGYYTLTGHYPAKMPMSQFFNPAKNKKAKIPKRKS